MENNLSKNILLSIIGVAILIIAVVGVSYAVIVTTSVGTNINKLNFGDISMSFVGNENSLSINNSYPLTDEEGKNLLGGNNVLEFNVSSMVASNSQINYEIVAEKNYNDELTYSDREIRIYLEKMTFSDYEAVFYTKKPMPFISNGDTSLYGATTESMILYRGILKNESDKTKKIEEKFKCRLWLSDNAIIDELQRSYKIKLNIYTK